VPISKIEQIDQRRNLVWQLYSRGMTQQEISDYLVENNYPPVSRRQIGYDIIWSKKESLVFVKENKKKLAEEYKKAVSNLEQLRAEAWKQFAEVADDNNSPIKVAMYDKIQSLTNNIMTLYSVGDTIHQEMLKNMQEEADDIKKEMDKIVDQRLKSQAVF
jgi:hypothetical protein